jgi:hypothetical protein
LEFQICAVPFIGLMTNKRYKFFIISYSGR